MPRLTPLPWRAIVCVFEQLGYRVVGQEGSHVKLTKPGTIRPIIVPRYDDVGRDIILGLIRTSGITRDAFLSLLQNC